MTEEKVSPMSKGTGKRGDNLPRQELTGLFEVSMEEEDRQAPEFQKLDRVLGGGIVKGSLTLVGGDPGIGKSTLLLQILPLSGKQWEKGCLCFRRGIFKNKLRCVHRGLADLSKMFFFFAR